jgi:hypothetical protein
MLITALLWQVMKIDYQNARQLCTATELSLLEDTKPKSLTKFTDAELKRKVTQARKYSDKWRELAKSQGNTSDGRSQQKHELFKEALSRFEGRLSRTAAAAKPVPPATKAPAAKKAPAKKAAKKAAKSFTPPERKGGPVIPLGRKAKQQAIGSEMRLATSGLTSRVRGHVSARGRRDQAARSSRKRS